jgi:UDP-N-acetylmuramate dehydrogenase
MVKLDRMIAGTVKRNEPIAAHTTMKVGGVVDAWIEPRDYGDLRTIITLSRTRKKPMHVIGNGSNFLVSDRKVKAWAVRLSSPTFTYLRRQGATVIAGAGTPLARLRAFCIKHGCAGLEFCAGIPGTVGGAVAMNAGLGAKNAQATIGRFVERITVMDGRGRLRTVTNDGLRFGYRNAAVNGVVILEAAFRLRKSRADSVKAAWRQAWEKKRSAQELTRPSAGCIFKNPYDGSISAGMLIELAGLKTKKIGGARISSKHANYIINTGRATFNDVIKLIELVQKTVKREFNVALELEVKILK